MRARLPDIDACCRHAAPPFTLRRHESLPRCYATILIRCARFCRVFIRHDYERRDLALFAEMRDAAAYAIDFIRRFDYFRCRLIFDHYDAILRSAVTHAGSDTLFIFAMPITDIDYFIKSVIFAAMMLRHYADFRLMLSPLLCFLLMLFCSLYFFFFFFAIRYVYHIMLCYASFLFTIYQYTV